MKHYVINAEVRDELVDLLTYLDDFTRRELQELSDQLSRNVLRTNAKWEAATKQIWEHDGRLLERIAAIEKELDHEQVQ